eukprot:TRINITY_DN1179_c1_g1_i11.p1 TRINITY_DN1179_c1_g1~~TRINITY_DN1179_c1_g1_i11.p1  ORF type:complete len:481 (+),score=58.70 TRINITY_DN1179_c1_g1_i11:436-1878(+)
MACLCRCFPRTSEARWKMLFVMGTMFGLLGTLLATGGPLFMHYTFFDIFHTHVVDTVTVSSTRSWGYERWQTYNSETNPYYLSFTFYNLSNADYFGPNAPPNPFATHDNTDSSNNTHGNTNNNNNSNSTHDNNTHNSKRQDILHLPRYNQIGPYVYRRFKYKEDVWFHADKESIQYRDKTWYVWEPTLSCPNCSEDDLITNVNPAYLKLMQHTSGEFQMQYAAGGKELYRIISFMNTTFVEDYCRAAYGETLVAELSPLLMSIDHTLNDKHASRNVFYAVWANATSPPDHLTPGELNRWRGWLLCDSTSKSDICPGSTGSGITMETARRLFAPEEADSLTNSSSATLGGPWAIAQTDRFVRLELQRRFDLTEQHMDIILNWLSSHFQEYLIEPFLVRKFNLTIIADLAYAQWGNATPLKGQSIADKYRGLFSRGNPEIWFLGANFTFTTSMARTFLSGPFGVSNPDNALDNYMMIVTLKK